MSAAGSFQNTTHIYIHGPIDIDPDIEIFRDINPLLFPDQNVAASLCCAPPTAPPSVHPTHVSAAQVNRNLSIE